MRIALVSLMVGTAVFAQTFAQSFVDPATAQKLVKDGAVLLDVRTPEEFKERHLDGALNIPVGDLEARLSEVGDKKRAVVVYCRVGRRAENAKQILLARGWKRVENLGGIDNWPAPAAAPAKK